MVEDGVGQPIDCSADPEGSRVGLGEDVVEIRLQVEGLVVVEVGPLDY
jgi:hypothetical protein